MGAGPHASEERHNGMNPAYGPHAVSIDAIPEPTAQCACPMCGAGKAQQEHKMERDCAEAVFRFAERVMWTERTNKGVGTIMRVVASRIINPGANNAQIASAIGITRKQVGVVVKQLEAEFPDVVRALWRERTQAK